MIVNSSFSQTI